VTEPEPTTPAEMRLRLTMIARGRRTLDINDNFGGLAAIVGNVHHAADAAGMSGEDRYTMMAWHLLQAAQRAQQVTLQLLDVTPSARIMAAVGPASKPE
jgi:hypothetical protein